MGKYEKAIKVAIVVVAAVFEIFNLVGKKDS